MSVPNQAQSSRREFITTAALGATAILAAPSIVTAKKSEAKNLIIGEGDYKYEVQHNWPQLPDKYTWQTTHNVAVDKSGNLYVIHEGRAEQKDHPSIFVFDDKGKFMRAFGSEFQGGGHGIEVRQEGSEEFLYICAYLNIKEIAKLTLKGENVWTRHAPMEAKIYADGEDSDHTRRWNNKAFLPTNIAFLDDGGFYLADGYGSFYIHRYDKHGNWKSMFGGPGKGKGKFNTPHGIWIDRRTKDEPKIVICDRPITHCKFLIWKENTRKQSRVSDCQQMPTPTKTCSSYQNS